MAKKEIVRKEPNVAQRVEILLREGVDKPETWATVHGYKEPSKYDLYDQDGHLNEVCFASLREHHLAETSFLLDVIREMREQILSLDEQLDRATELLNGSKRVKVYT